MIGKFLLAVALLSTLAEARVVKLRVERREAVLNGKAFGLAGPYEKIVGKVDFALDPSAAPNCRNHRSEPGAPKHPRRGGILR